MSYVLGHTLLMLLMAAVFIGLVKLDIAPLSVFGAFWFGCFYVRAEDYLDRKGTE